MVLWPLWVRFPSFFHRSSTFSVLFINLVTAHNFSRNSEDLFFGAYREPTTAFPSVIDGSLAAVGQFSELFSPFFHFSSPIHQPCHSPQLFEKFRGPFFRCLLGAQHASAVACLAQLLTADSKQSCQTSRWQGCTLAP